MKVIELTGNPPTLKEILELAGHENVVLRTAEGREFVLAELDDFDREIELVRQNDSLMKLFRSRATEKGKHSLSDVRKLLNGQAPK